MTQAIETGGACLRVRKKKGFQPQDLRKENWSRLLAEEKGGDRREQRQDRKARKMVPSRKEIPPLLSKKREYRVEKGKGSRSGQRSAAP